MIFEGEKIGYCYSVLASVLSKKAEGLWIVFGLSTVALIKTAIAYLNGANNLEIIKCISMWSRKEIKMSLLFVNSKEEMYTFVDKIRDYYKPTRDTNVISENRTSISFTKKFPYGNVFLIEFAYVNNICIAFM